MILQYWQSGVFFCLAADRNKTALLSFAFYDIAVLLARALLFWGITSRVISPFFGTCCAAAALLLLVFASCTRVKFIILLFFSGNDTRGKVQTKGPKKGKRRPFVKREIEKRVESSMYKTPHEYVLSTSVTGKTKDITVNAVKIPRDERNRASSYTPPRQDRQQRRLESKKEQKKFSTCLSR